MCTGIKYFTVLPAKAAELLDIACRNFFFTHHLGNQLQQRVLGLTERLHRTSFSKIGDIPLAQADFYLVIGYWSIPDGFGENNVIKNKGLVEAEGDGHGQDSGY